MGPTTTYDTTRPHAHTAAYAALGSERDRLGERIDTFDYTPAEGHAYALHAIGLDLLDALDGTAEAVAVLTAATTPDTPDPDRIDAARWRIQAASNVLERARDEAIRVGIGARAESITAETVTTEIARLTRIHAEMWPTVRPTTSRPPVRLAPVRPPVSGDSASVPVPVLSVTATGASEAGATRA